MNDTTRARPTTRLIVLASGGGSNFQAIAEALRKRAIAARIVAVISDKRGAKVLERARKLDIDAEVVDFSAFDCRAAFDEALRNRVQMYAPDLVLLAGYMRILDDPFVDQWQGRLINIHPSLLPAYRGLHTHRRVLADGESQHGATVHFVVPELDAGQIIVQAQLLVHPDDDESQLAARVLRMEHIIYPMAIEWFVDDRLSIVGEQVLLDGVASDHQRLKESDIIK